MARSIQAVRGMNDILPAQTAAWQHLEAVLRDVVHAYGYSEIRMPLLEKTERTVCQGGCARSWPARRGIATTSCPPEFFRGEPRNFPLPDFASRTGRPGAALIRDGRLAQPVPFVGRTFLEV